MPRVALFIAASLFWPLRTLADSTTPRFDFANPDVRVTDIITKGGGSIGDVIVALASFLIPAAGVLAVVVMLAAGIVRVMSAGSSERVGLSGEMMWGALTGLVIALGSYVFLTTINPKLTHFEDIRLPRIQRGIPAHPVAINLTDAPGGDGSNEVGSDGSTTNARRGPTGSGRQNLLGIEVCGGIPVQNHQRLQALYRGGDTATVNFQGRPVTVHQSAVAAFQAWDADLRQIAASDPSRVYRIVSIGGLANRQNVNDPRYPSFHSYGIAVDINPGENQNHSTRTAIPQWFVESAYRSGFRWGGQWNSGTPDSMHFEYIGGGGFYGPDGTEQTRVTTRSSQGDLCPEDFAP